MKRILSLLLTILLLAGSVLPAGAVSFVDGNDIQNLDAVTLMVNLGLVQGYETGLFLPRNNLRRSEAAKLASLICEDAPTAKNAASYADVAKNFWAAGFISYCTEKEIMVGAGGKFRPNDYVTGREFAKILLVCLGYDGNRYVGSKWYEYVDTDAENLGIYAGCSSDPAAILSRDNACLLMYNAMQCYAVAGVDSQGQDIYVVDELMNPVTYMEHRFKVVKYEGVLEANAYADLTKTGGRLADGMSKLVGHAPFEVDTSYDFLGRKVEIYALRTTHMVLGVPHLTDGKQVTRTNDEESFLLALRYSDMTMGATTRYYYNGDRVRDDLFGRMGTDYVITAVNHDGDKILDAVMVTDYRQGTVTQVSPLTIAVGQRELPGGFLGGTRTLQVGDTVRCAEVAGRFLVD